MIDRKTEFEFTDGDFNALREIITKNTGIELPDDKKTLMYSRIARRLRALKMKSFADYAILIKGEVSSGKKKEFFNMLNVMTTNVTSFFRENHHFEDLKAVLPELLEKYGKVNIWSCASSTGEEPWSIAMVVAEYLQKNPMAKITITASDLDETALEKAKAGIYHITPDALKNTPYLKNWLEKVPGKEPKPFTGEEEYRIPDSLRKLITYKQINLLDALPFSRDSLQVVFCRNVIIYFSNDTKRTLFAKIEEKMISGSKLYLGHSESLINVSEAFEPAGRTTYVKT